MLMRSHLGVLFALVAACSSSGSPDDDNDGDNQGSADAGDQQQSPDAAAVVEQTCVAELNAGYHEVDCNGIKFNFNVPTQCEQKACGLIFDVHGRTMSGDQENNNTKLRELGAANDFIVVQPNGNPAPPQSGWSEADDDEVYSFMQQVIARWDVDQNRVHMTGFSQGGYMTWRFICKHADVLASAAPAAAAQGCIDANVGCVLEPGKPSTQVDILYMHGRDDAIVSYNCAEPQRDSVVNSFGMGAPEVVAGDDKYEWTRYTSPQATTFEFIAHRYKSSQFLLKGHCFPGSDDDGDEPGQLFSFKCNDQTAFNWGEEVIKFFMAHPRTTGLGGP